MHRADAVAHNPQLADGLLGMRMRFGAIAVMVAEFLRPRRWFDRWKAGCGSGSEPEGVFLLEPGRRQLRQMPDADATGKAARNDGPDDPRREMRQR